MELDTGTRAFLDMLKTIGGPPIHEQPVSSVRDGIKALTAQVGPTPVEVARVSDRKIPGPGGEIGVRLYFPRTTPASERLPIVMQYHGGGWVIGDLDTHDAICRYYSKHADAIVVSVDYRLAPEHKFPAAVDDSFAALAWAVEHAGELGANPDRVAVTGDSAGGTLSTVVCQLAKARGGPKIAFQALLYPAVDLGLDAHYPSRKEFGGGDYFLSLADMQWFASHYFTNPAREAKDPRASPLLSRDLNGLPPALVVTAGFDLLRDEGKVYSDRLAAAGVPVEYHCFEGTIHAFLSFGGAIPAGAEGLTIVASRLRQALHG